ncbi:hypothetical protein BH20ACT3_BH20ACT3_05900 [soil metagenome]
MLVLVILAVVWAGVIGSWALGNRRAGRPDNSVASFRAQLSTLERATPGTSLRPSPAVAPSSGLRSPSVSSPRSVTSLPMTQADVRRRRRGVLVGLLGATGVTFVLWVVVGGPAVTMLGLASAGGLCAYVFALRQLKLRSTERTAKVRTLVPRTAPVPSPALRRAAAN